MHQPNEMMMEIIKELDTLALDIHNEPNWFDRNWVVATIKMKRKIK